MIAALAEKRGSFRLDMLRHPSRIQGLEEGRADAASGRLGHRADVPVSDLAYGEKRRLEIGLALATSPSLLLLDEPLAGMSPRERAETVRLLKNISRGRTTIMIDHDMDALFELAERVTVLQEGRVLVEGTPDEIKANPRRAGSLSRRSAGAMSLLEVDGLNSYYGDSHILFDVSLRVERHEVVALLGRNGAGKSTTLKSLMGVVRPASGSVRFDGDEFAGKPSHAIAGGACSSSMRIAASSAASMSRRIIVLAEPDRGEALAAGSHLRNVSAPEGAPRAAEGPICPAANSRCWPSPAPSSAIPKSCCWTSRSRGWPRSSCATCGGLPRSGGGGPDDRPRRTESGGHAGARPAGLYHQQRPYRPRRPVDRIEGPAGAHPALSRRLILRLTLTSFTIW